jgi:hypothetical protein
MLLICYSATIVQSLERYDTSLKRQIRFTPQRAQTPVDFLPPDGEMLDVIATPGTCGDPRALRFRSWRVDEMLPVLLRKGLQLSDMANVEVAEWTPDDAVRESILFARSQVIAMGITNDQPSWASLAESGFMFYGGLLRGQEVLVHMADIQSAPPESVRARKLVYHMFQALEQQYPFFRLAPSVPALAVMAADALTARRWQQNNGVSPTVYAVDFARSPQLAPGIYLSGTSGETRPVWLDVATEYLAKARLPTEDSYRRDWHEGHIGYELQAKLNYAVQLIAITGETPSLGALAELGARLAYAHHSKQKVGLFIEPYGSDLKSPANRTRRLVLEHISRLKEDFPSMQLYMASGIDDLARYGEEAYQASGYAAR